MTDDSQSSNAYCTNCGHAQPGSRFCGRCGGPMGSPIPPSVVVPSEPTATLPVVDLAGAQPTSVHRKVRKMPFLVVTTVLVVALLGGSAYWAFGPSGSDYESSASELFSVVVNDNVVIQSKVESLVPGSTSASLQASVVVAISDTEDAMTGLESLPNSNASTEDDLRAALIAESTWLHTLLSVLKQPSVAPPIPLSIARDSAVSAFTRVEFLGKPHFPQIDGLTSWSNQNFREKRFNYAVVSILQQSATILPTLNYFYSQLQEAATYGDASISLYQAESDIQTIISSRQEMLRRTQLLISSNPATANIQVLLENAFNASLRNDLDLYSCLHQYSNGWSTYIAQSCLDASQPDNAAASNAKNAFKAAYNVLRSRLGLPMYNGSF